MATASTEQIVFFDFHPELADFHQQILDGLTVSPKRILSKFFYDKRGSELFERITTLKEYYPTRTEIAILEQHSREIAELIGKDGLLIEYGSGSSRKIRILLDALAGHPTYIAIDISRDHLIESASILAEHYPAADVVAVCADYTQPFVLPPLAHGKSTHPVVFFPGSTIGNFSREQARSFLRTTAETVGEDGSLLIGVDLKKDGKTLHAAYNDMDGVTAEFNLNLLHRINAEIGADFDVDSFQHQAFYNEDRGCVEMHLVSGCQQSVRINGSRITFERGETIHTEDSHKFGVGEFQELARESGFKPARVWTDSDSLFSVHYLEVA